MRPQTAIDEGAPRPKSIASHVRSTADGATRKNDLTMKVEVQGKIYRFMIDNGAEISLVQPYVENHPVNHTHHMIKGITGDLLRAEVACEVQFKLCSRC
jgi:hypothetical protein